jgi:hypothetical protein
MKPKVNSSGNKILDVAVILDDDNTLRDVIATDSDFTVVVEPKSPRHLFRLLGKWAKEGKRVRRLILAGHGHWTEHHIGSILPKDFDLNGIRDRRRKAYQDKIDADKKVVKDEALLPTVKESKQRKEIQERISDSKNESARHAKVASELQSMERELVDMEDVMVDGAVVGLINCCAAYDQGGRDFMNNIAETLLSKHGGRITGCTGIVDVKTVDSILAGMVYWLHNGEWRYADEPVLKGERWVSIEKVSTGETHRRCGAPCKDFERYGFCDFPVSEDGPCFMHR